jgi:hypothetical protein
MSPFAYGERKLIVLVGTRGICLLIFGTMWLILGLAFTANPIDRFSQPGPGSAPGTWRGVLDFLDKTPGAYLFASMWLVGGATAVIVAFQRPLTCRDDWGFNGAALPPFFWGAAYWWSFFTHAITDGEFGRPNTYLAGILYWTLLILIVFLSRHLSDHPEGPCAKRRAATDGTRVY